MSDSRRSSRAKKVVNYSTFGAGDDDDDFADPTPPAKKSKSTNKETKPSRVKAVQESRRAEEKTSKPKISCNRQPLDEKLFDRDLEAALKLSLLSSQESESAAEVTVQTLPDRQATPALQTSAIGDSTVNKRLLGSVVEEDDKIIELSPETADTNPRKRQRAARKSVTYEGDSDGGGEDEPWAPKDSQAESDQVSEDDEVDDDEFDPDDSDSEYESSRKKKSRKPQKTKPAAKKAPAKPRAKASTSVTPVTKKTTVSSKVVTPKITSRSAPSTPSYSTPVRAGGVPLKRSWVPPGRSGALSSPLSANSMKSPSGGLRLGLSRNQKVKSLHPSVTCS